MLDYFMRNKIRLLIVVALTLFGLIATRASDLVDEQWVLFKVHSTLTLTDQMTIGYSRPSVGELVARLNTGDVPALIRLFNKHADRLGVGMAIVTQCGAGLAGLTQMARIDYDAIQLARDIAASATCTPASRAAASAKIAELESQEAAGRRNDELESQANLAKKVQKIIDAAYRHSHDQKPPSPANSTSASP